MRILITSDLHYNHARSRASADELIDQVNARGDFDVLLVIGDVSVPAGDTFEQCLARFTHAGEKLFVPGNHELWTTGGDSHGIHADELPARTRAAGWHWLPGQPFTSGDVAIVGSLGWYDYSFAPDYLGIPRRFYEHKVSPAVAPASLGFDDVPADAMQLLARWNDGKFVHLGRSDEQFLGELLTQLDQDLATTRNAGSVLAAIHHLPFHHLLPPNHNPGWDFAKAFLGSDRIGQLLLEYPNVKHVYCGHSHFAAEADIGHLHAVSTGSGYRTKTIHLVDLV